MDTENSEHDDRRSFDKSRFETISEQRRTLPIYAFREDIVNTVKTQQILILVGETGSGKTTQLAQYLYEEGFAEKGMIGITQPRRVGAVSVARRVCEESGTSMGDVVGYSVRFSDKTSRSTKIKYMTDGVMLRECLMDPLLRDYSVIILDEAHERSVHTDILFGLMKVSLSKRPDLKLLITSATLDDEKFSKFFDDCPTFFVPGRSFPVDIFHAEKKPRTDIVDSAVETALNIHLSEPEGDILVFLTGQQEIEDACARVEKKLEIAIRKLEEEKSNREVLDLMILPLYAALPPGEQIKIFEPTPARTRKLVIATNIAETSLTVNGIVYVIDPGYVKQKIFNPRTGMESLEVVLISKVAAQQRAGRAGRTKAGKCYRLYTQSIYSEMDDVTVPEIQRSNLSNIVLTLKALGIHDVLSFQFLDPPDPFLIVQAMKHLYQLGALDEEGRLTTIGKQMSVFPLEPSYSRMLLGSIQEKCSDEMLTLISMLSVENLFFRPSQKKFQDIAEEKRRELYLDADHTSSSPLPGDHVMLLYIYNTWHYYKKSNVWTKEYFIQNKALEEANEIRKQLVELMKKEKLDIIKCNKQFDKIAYAMCSGLYMNYARHSSRSTKSSGSSSEHMYVIPKTGQLACIHPMSLLIVTDKEPPVWVVYTDLIQTTRPFLRLAIGVKYEWVDDLLVKTGKIDVNKLIGRDVREIIAASMIAPKEEDTEKKDVPDSLNEKFQRKNDDAAVEAARQRYLQRKAAQEANQPSKKKKTQ